MSLSSSSHTTAGLSTDTSSTALATTATGLLGYIFASLANLSVFKFCYIAFLCYNTSSLAKYSDLNLFDYSIA